MKQLYRYFFRGLITILPLALTVYLLYIFLAWTERLALLVLRPFIGSFYIPGMGLVLGILIIIAIGFLTTKKRVVQALTLVERPFTNIPVIKSIYSSLKSFADYFSPGGKQDAQQVVALRVPGQPWEVVGLVTRRDIEGLPAGFMQGDRVAVYLPMGYMIGGYTVFVPRDWINPIQMSVEEAMRSSLIAWMAGANGQARPEPGAWPGPGTGAVPGTGSAAAGADTGPGVAGGAGVAAGAGAGMDGAAGSGAGAAGPAAADAGTRGPGSGGDTMPPAH